MLDKKLCELFNIDSFTQALMMRLDKAEDMYYEALELGADRVTIAELKTELDTLKGVRDDWCKYKKEVELPF